MLSLIDTNVFVADRPIFETLTNVRQQSTIRSRHAHYFRSTPLPMLKDRVSRFAAAYGE